MAGEDEVTTPSGAPTSWRDVYALVQDSEKRLTSAINDGFNRQTAVTADHEVRIRVLEASDQRDGANNRTTQTAIGSAQKVIVTVVLICNFAIGVVALMVN